MPDVEVIVGASETPTTINAGASQDFATATDDETIRSDAGSIRVVGSFSTIDYEVQVRHDLEDDDGQSVDAAVKTLAPGDTNLASLADGPHPDVTYLRVVETSGANPIDVEELAVEMDN